MEPVVHQEKFSLSYDDVDGDFSRHTIDAATLAKVISGVCDLLNGANKQLGKGSEIDIRVTAPAKEGSLGIDFMVLADIAESFTVLNMIGFGAAAFIGGSLIEVVKKLKNKRILRITINEQDGTTELETEDGVVKCSTAVARLVTDKKVRDALHNVIQVPISGIDGATLKVTTDGDNPEELLNITEQESFYYSPLPTDHLDSEEVTIDKVSVYFIQVNFDDPSKWKAITTGAGGKKFSLEMRDEAFFKKVQQNNQSFSKEDLFSVTLETTKVSRMKRSTTKYVITSVDRHFADKDRRLI